MTPTPDNGVVLIVDDSPDLADVIRSAIVSELGCEALVASDVGHAEHYLESLAPPPRLVVLDVHLPGTSGLAFYDIMQRDKVWREIPVLFLTAAADEEAFRSRHFKNVLAKPFKLDALLSKVSEYCCSQR
jgi:CheY-like chemotaxis protein